MVYVVLYVVQAVFANEPATNRWKLAETLRPATEATPTPH